MRVPIYARHSQELAGATNVGNMAYYRNILREEYEEMHKEWSCMLYGRQVRLGHDAVWAAGASGITMLFLLHDSS